MKPDPFESMDFSISDVACGTAGFIISSFEWYKSIGKIDALTTIQKKKVLNRTYYGQELVVRPRRMAQMNLFLHGLNPSNIDLGDTIYSPLGKKRFTCILTNPPFGNKGASQIPDRPDFKIKTSNKQLNFIQHVASCLDVKGRAAIIVPDNVLFEEKASELWNYLMKDYNIHTILKLPDGIFMPYANVKANVVYFQKGLPTKNVWIFDARTNVNAVTKKDRPLMASHFQVFENCYGVDPNGNSKRKDLGLNGRFRKFSKEEIIHRKYRLDITWLNENNNTDTDKNTSTENIVRQAITRTQNMVQHLNSVLSLLENNDNESSS